MTSQVSWIFHVVFGHLQETTEEGPSGPLLVHRVPSAPPRRLIFFWGGWWIFHPPGPPGAPGPEFSTSGRPILCADDPEATLLKAPIW